MLYILVHLLLALLVPNLMGINIIIILFRPLLSVLYSTIFIFENNIASLRCTKCLLYVTCFTFTFGFAV